VNLERIRERLSNGFKPFALELSSGKRVSILHPDFLALGRGVVVGVGENDSVATLDALRIVAIEDLPTGRRRK
jgi:hypothetical protein